MIRPSHAGDLPAVVDMAERFWALTDYEEEFERPHVAKIVEACHDDNLLLVVELDGMVEGFAAAIVAPLLGNSNVLHALELAYWINPESRGHGVALLRGLERLVKIKGCKYLNMVAMESSDPKRAAEIYEALGYKRAETLYRKRL